MKRVRILNRTRESVLGSRVGLADHWWSRTRGFLGRPSPANGEGLLLSPCRAVHTMGMKFTLDVLFLDRQGRVLALYPDLGPRRHTAWHGTARYALEVPAGTIAASGTQEGDLIVWLPLDVPESEESGNGRRSGAPEFAVRAEPAAEAMENR